MSSLSNGVPENRKNIPVESVRDIRVHGKLLSSVRFTRARFLINDGRASRVINYFVVEVKNDLMPPVFFFAPFAFFFDQRLKVVS